MINPTTRGDPMSPLRWTCKSTRTLAAELGKQGYRVSPSTVRGLLVTLGYSLQANRKKREGKQHPDRDGQFQHINARVLAQKRRGAPAISVDTKKKETLGNKKNPGRTYEPKGKPERSIRMTFPIRSKAKQCRMVFTTFIATKPECPSASVLTLRSLPLRRLIVGGRSWEENATRRESV